MVISFNTRFVEPIQKGSKIHTIRKDDKNRWKPGMTMHMYTGGRFSKEYREFAKKECVSTQEIFMTYYNGLLEITVDDTYLFGHQERTNFAISDGFESWDAFKQYWIPVLNADPERKYKGKVIHWTKFWY